MREAGTSFLFVSHDMESVRRLCQNALVLDGGRPEFVGPSTEAINRYHGLVFRATGPRVSTALPPRAADPREGMTPAEVRAGNILDVSGGQHGNGALEIAAARVTDGTGRPTLRVRLEEPLHFDLLIVARERASFPAAGILLYDQDRNIVLSCGTSLHGHVLPELAPQESLVVRVSVHFTVRPGAYTFTLGLSDQGQAQDWREALGPVEVYFDGEGPPPFYGMADLPFTCAYGSVGVAPRGAGQAAEGLVPQRTA
jgi:homopolymeric O-antigen transport system ATP-binding protein